MNTTGPASNSVSPSKAQLEPLKESCRQFPSSFSQDGGSGVLVGGTGVGVGSGVLVGGIGVDVGSGVLVGGTGVEVGSEVDIAKVCAQLVKRASKRHPIKNRFHNKLVFILPPSTVIEFSSIGDCPNTTTRFRQFVSFRAPRGSRGISVYSFVRTSGDSSTTLRSARNGECPKVSL